MPTLIQTIAEGAAGKASLIAVQAFNESEVLTALRNDSGNLELIGWRTAPQDAVITRRGDSGTQAGTAKEVALTLMETPRGRRAITAVRSGSDRLLLIPWDVSPGLNTISRLPHDTGTAAGEASQIAMTAIGDDMLVTAVRAGDGNLLLICWRLEPDDTISRLNDSTKSNEGVPQAGEVSLVTIAALDPFNVVTAVRNGSGNLELIGWNVSPDGEIQRWDGDPGQAGEVGEIALIPIASGGPTSDVLTAVKTGSDNLKLITWRLSPDAATIERLADSGDAAGTASHIAVCATNTTSGLKFLASMRRGSDNLAIIAFEVVADGPGGIIRTGDYSNEANADVTETALVSLDPGRILNAMRITREDGEPDNHLLLTTYGVSDIAPTLIQTIAEGAAGKASLIAVHAFNESEVLTALRNDSGNLQLIGWHTPPQDTVITRGPEAHAGTAKEVALTLMETPRGRRAITAVRSGSDRLLLIPWDVSPGLDTISRLPHDTGTAAGEASQIAMTAIGDDMLVTAVRAGDGNLLLICWRLEPDDTISRLNDSTKSNEGVPQAGEVSLVTIAALDPFNVVTAVRNGSGNLELIGWNVSPDGEIQRWDGDPGQAGEVGEIALIPIASGGPTSDVLTAVKTGSDNLKLITWRLSPDAATIERLADSGDAAGTASHIAVCATNTTSGLKFLASMRRGSDNLAIIAFEVVADGPGGIIRTGDYSNEANADVTETALVSLDPGRILNAMRITRKCEEPDNHLLLTTYGVSDPVTIPAPATILEIEYENPCLPPSGFTAWAASGGNTFPVDVSTEWAQVLGPKEEYEGSALVGCTGWVIQPEDSGADVPFSHPFGFDWEFQVALDDDEKGYQALLSPANTTPEGRAPELANALGLPVSHGLLGVEWDKGLLPQSFRGRVNHGDRVAIFGRWILDTGHDKGGFWRTEIHPPLMVATGSVQRVRGNPQSTRVLFMSRPYLPGQRYTVDPNDAYVDAAKDDGPFFRHIVHELARVIRLASVRVEAHPKIKSFPFRGAYRLHIIVRPPPPPDSGDFRLAVSFQFTVRKGCDVQVTSTSRDTVDVFVSLNDEEYDPPDLPNRNECSYGPLDLDKLSGGSGIRIIGLEALTTAVAALVGSVFGIGAILAALVATILARGIKTDTYDALPEINILDSGNAVLNAFADEIPAGAGVVVDNEQHYPIYGWLEAKWVRKTGRKPPLTTANLNEWLKSVLADPARARDLKETNWVQLLQSEFVATKEQAESLSLVPPEHVMELQKAIGMVVDYGGTIHVERKSEHSPGEVFVEPKAIGPEVAALSVGVFHCRFDANCRNWRCGWGPAKKK